MSARAPKPDRGRCAYCREVTGSPSKITYEPSPDGSHSRFAHHRRVALLEGREVLPLCRLAALASGR